MTASILAILAGLVSALVWWLRNSPERKHAALLAAVKKLKEDYADALARGDAAAAAACQRRLRELAAEAGRPL